MSHNEPCTVAATLLEEHIASLIAAASTNPFGRELATVSARANTQQTGSRKGAAAQAS